MWGDIVEAPFATGLAEETSLPVERETSEKDATLDFADYWQSIQVILARYQSLLGGTARRSARSPWMPSSGDDLDCALAWRRDGIPARIVAASIAAVCAARRDAAERDRPEADGQEVNGQNVKGSQVSSPSPSTTFFERRIARLRYFDPATRKAFRDWRRSRTGAAAGGSFAPPANSAPAFEASSPGDFPAPLSVSLDFRAGFAARRRRGEAGWQRLATTLAASSSPPSPAILAALEECRADWAALGEPPEMSASPESDCNVCEALADWDAAEDAWRRRARTLCWEAVCRPARGADCPTTLDWPCDYARECHFFPASISAM